MFNCSVCKESIGPNVKPVQVVTGKRNVSYHNEYYVEDEWGNREKKEVDSVGTEITGVELACPNCVGAVAVTAPSTTIRIGGSSFREKEAETFTAKLVSHIAYSALDRLEDRSKRARQDAEAAIPLVKAFVDENKGFNL